jgi:hypothetical protein
MKMRFSNLFLSIGLLATPAAAQNDSAGMLTPTLGFIFDSNQRAIRPIHGIPGAAVPGEALDLGVPIRIAAISPRQDFALLVSAIDQTVSLARLPGGAASALPAEGAPDRIVFSPSGQAAVLYRQSVGQIQILTGLPDAPQVHAPAASTQAPAGIADDGTLAPAGQDSAWPASFEAMAFRRNSRELVAITRAGDLYFARGVSSTPDFRLVYRGDSDTSDPVALQLSDDGLRAFAVNREGLVTAVDLATGSAQSISCQCQPVTLHPLRPGGMFRLTEFSDQPLMLFDASAIEPRVWFVPPRRAASDSGEINQ